MKRAMLVTGLILLTVAVSACGAVQDAGSPTSEHRDITGVHAVDLQTSGDLTIRTGETEGLTITAGANAIDDLTSDVVDGTLVLGSKPSIPIGGSIGYTLTVDGLDRIELEGSGSVNASGVLSGDASVSVSGSGSATLTELQLTSLTADLSGSGATRVSGSATGSTVDVSGSGDYDGSALTTRQTRIDVSGSGQARVNVGEQLSATVSGSGDVVYTGNPPVVQGSTTGSGKIVPG